jgi:hypothetical protein
MGVASVQSSMGLVSFQLGQVFRKLALALIIVFAILAVGATVGAAIGVLPWLTFTATFELFEVPQSGMFTQIFLTILLLALCFFVPSANRMIALERSHRDFKISMQDVAMAYAQVHAADRARVFTVSSEFDEVRERMEYLRDHPDLQMLEPGVLDLAAQMGQHTRALADVYSDNKVARARTFLKQRQEEVEAFERRLATAKTLTQDLRRWTEQIDMEEGIQQAQLERIEPDLLELLPELGFDLDGEDDGDTTVVPMASLPSPQHRHPAE